MSDKGRVWPSEIKPLRDKKTGAAVWQVTDHPSVNHNLYFLTTSFLPDENSLIFASFRSGTPNFFRTGFPEGSIVQLTDADDINSFSGLISKDGSRFFFTRGSSLVELLLDDLSERVLADFPGGNLGEVDLSPDGRWAVTAVRMDGENGIGIAATDAATDGSGGEIVYRQKDTVVHPQFHPTDGDTLEFASDPAPRMYLLRRDGTGKRCLHEHTNYEYVVHETWLGRTGDMIYTYWPQSIVRVRIPSLQKETVANLNAWHISPGADGEFILCDTHLPDRGIQLVETATGRQKAICLSESSNAGTQWAKGRYAEKADFEEAARTGACDLESARNWTDMKTDTVYGPQWTHPHPSFSPSERLATFTSDRSGHSQVYVVEIDKSF